MMVNTTSHIGRAFMSKARSLLLGAALAVLAGASGAVAFESPRSAADLMDAVMWNREDIGGPFALTDQHGKLRTQDDFKGKYLLVYFGFTYCPNICPTDLHEITQAMDKLGPLATNIQPVYITVDPERDTVEHLSQYITLFHQSFVALTGTVKETSAAADAYRTFYKKVSTGQAADDYTIDHSAFIYFVNRDGKYLGFFPPGTDADKLVATLKPMLEAEGK